MNGRWARAVAEHRAALERVLETIRAAEPERWSARPRPDAWSAAQIAEHLVLYYEAVLAELAGQAPMRPRVGPGWRAALRWVLLPHILFHRAVPLKARAPREVRPSETGLVRDTALRRLSELAARFERAMAAAHRERRRLHHPYFGQISTIRMMRFSAVHLEHHRQQVLERSA